MKFDLNSGLFRNGELTFPEFLLGRNEEIHTELRNI